MKHWSQAVLQMELSWCKYYLHPHGVDLPCSIVLVFLISSHEIPLHFAFHHFYCHFLDFFYFCYLFSGMRWPIFSIQSEDVPLIYIMALQYFQVYCLSTSITFALYSIIFGPLWAAILHFEQKSWPTRLVVSVQVPLSNGKSPMGWGLWLVVKQAHRDSSCA